MPTFSRIVTATSLIALTLAGACDTADYVTYRVASASSVQDANCYPDGVPDSIRDDSSSLRAASSLNVFEGPEDERFLEFADVALAGSVVDGVYSFSGETVDVEYPTPELKTKQSAVHDISFTEDGKYITGTYTLTTTTTCTGPTDQCDLIVQPTCTTTTEFTGSRVETELTHEL
ncbi:MAG: hypothetical protein H6713_12385 [Myxococcales bacterium]|nr:hypothetical protein [Myxococcales bacterium]MCB9750775.1 hypothetical protein [Myxococcales bacterium]